MLTTVGDTFIRQCWVGHPKNPSIISTAGDGDANVYFQGVDVETFTTCSGFDTHDDWCSSVMYSASTLRNLQDHISHKDKLMTEKFEANDKLITAITLKYEKRKKYIFQKSFFFSNKIPISSYFRIFSVMSLSLDSNFSVMSLSLWLIWPCKFLRVEALYINTPTPVIMSVKVWAWGESFDIDSLKVYVGISVAGCEAWLLVLRQQWIFSSCLIRYIPKYDPEYVTPTVSKGQRAGAESRIVLDHES